MNTLLLVIGAMIVVNVGILVLNRERGLGGAFEFYGCLTALSALPAGLCALVLGAPAAVFLDTAHLSWSASLLLLSMVVTVVVALTAVGRCLFARKLKDADAVHLSDS